MILTALVWLALSALACGGGFLIGRITAPIPPPKGTLPMVWAEPESDGIRVCAAYNRMPPRYSGIVAEAAWDPHDVVQMTRTAMQKCIEEISPS